MSVSEEVLKQLPAHPGVYLMRDARGRIIYIGKAVNLRQRVRSYFREKRHDDRASLVFLMRRVAALDWVLTDTEKEALLLEDTLIKQHAPRYNIDLRDDKTYLSLKVSVKDEFPRISVTRHIAKDGSAYFGPYTSAQSARDTLRTIEKTFQIRSCNDTFFKNRVRPCLAYQIRRCLGPCVLDVDSDLYARRVENSILLLKGKNAEVMRHLTAEMQAASERMEYEEAARIRDQIRAIERTVERQKVVSHHATRDRDAVHYAVNGRTAQVAVARFRGGRMSGLDSFPVKEVVLPGGDLLSAFLRRYYLERSDIPPEILLPEALGGGRSETAALEELLSERRGGRVAFKVPRRGPSRQWVEMAGLNAAGALKQRLEEGSSARQALEELQRRLRLPYFPRRIECFDMSNLKGRQAVGSMTVFESGSPARSLYRHFKIKHTKNPAGGGDDFAMMYEVLYRRYRKASEDPPDLIVVDGGKGQLKSALAVLAELGLHHIPAIGLAKARAAVPGGTGKPERVFLPRRKDPVVLRPGSGALRVLQHIRDEAHRFAIGHHRRLRRGAQTHSELDRIPGVGPARKRALLQHFARPADIAGAEVEALRRVPGISADLAQRIHAFFHASSPSEE